MKKYKLLIDIDGVVRNICFFINPAPKTWKDGSSIFKLVKENPNILISAPTTKYYSVIKSLIKHPIFLSTQPESWRPYTDKWLANHFESYKVIYVLNFLEKVAYINRTRYILEDYPHFKDYSNVILIDAAYNKNVKNAALRIKTKERLKYFLMNTNK